MKKLLLHILLFFNSIFFVSCSNGSSSIQNIINSYQNGYLSNIPDSTFSVEGNPSAKIRIDAFINVLCPHCRVFETTLSQLINDEIYQDKIQVHYHFVLLGFPDEQPITKLHLYMSSQNQLKQFREVIIRNEIFTYQESLNIAQKMLKHKIRDKDLEAQTALLKKEHSIASQKSINYSPFIFINGVHIELAPQGLEEWREFINYLDKG